MDLYRFTHNGLPENLGAREACRTVVMVLVNLGVLIWVFSAFRLWLPGDFWLAIFYYLIASFCFIEFTDMFRNWYNANYKRRCAAKLNAAAELLYADNPQQYNQRVNELAQMENFLESLGKSYEQLDRIRDKLKDRKSKTLRLMHIQYMGAKIKKDLDDIIKMG